MIPHFVDEETEALSDLSRITKYDLSLESL